jgi:hypothetical protein
MRGFMVTQFSPRYVTMWACPPLVCDGHEALLRIIFNLAGNNRVSMPDCIIPAGHWDTLAPGRLKGLEDLPHAMMENPEKT